MENETVGETIKTINNKIRAKTKEKKEVMDKANGGNTRNRSRCWLFTLNNPEKYGYNDFVSVSQMLDNEDAVSYIFQLEKGAMGTLHYQGFVQFHNQREFKSMKKICPNIHWEKCKNMKASQLYCQKEDTRVRGPWSKNIIIEKEKKKFIKEFRPWQKDIWDMLQSEPNDRDIIWILDTEGNNGKTLLAKHLYQEMGAMYVQGKGADIKYTIAKAKIKPKIVIWDIVRSQEGKISYEAIESIKNGIFMSGKYESETVVMDTPHIVCFANWEPDYECLSKDRWKVFRIKDSELV